MYYAHTPNEQAGEWHDLEEHIREVARLAQEFAAPLGAADSAEMLGYCHDFGKFAKGFQDYLIACHAGTSRRGQGPDHKAAGTQWALEQRLGLLALLVQGHHGGLHAPAEMKQWLTEKTKDGTFRAAVAAARQTMPDVFTRPAPTLPDFVMRDKHAAEMFLRLLFSALVDADYLDTERHFDPDKAAVRGVTIPMAELWDRYEWKRTELTARSASSPVVARARDEIYQACLAHLFV